MGRDEVVEDSITKKLKSLVALGQIVAGVARMGQRLKQETPFFEIVTQNVLHFICHHITIEPL